MTFEGLLGQDAAIGTLRRALAAGRVHHAYRFEGPEGVGKERVAMALAQALLCDRSGGRADGCGVCSSCARVTQISRSSPHVPLHPDVILVERGLYPADTLGTKSEETKDISVAQLRKVVVARMAFPPHEGRARVVIVRRAEELGIAAANTLLKTLEEPPAGTHFVLLSSRGRMMIDTIRSRSQLVRFAPLGEAVLGQILRARGVADEVIASAVALAGGSAAQAIEAADPEATGERVAFVEAVMAAVASPDAGAALALAQARDKDRDVVKDRLTALSAWLARASRDAVDDGARSRKLAECFSIALQALRELDRNLAPALLIESMVLRMRAVAG